VVERGVVEVVMEGVQVAPGGEDQMVVDAEASVEMAEQVQTVRAAVVATDICCRNRCNQCLGRNSGIRFPALHHHSLHQNGT